MARSAAAAASVAAALAAHARPMVIGIAETCPAASETVSVGVNYALAVSESGNIPFVIPRFGDDAQLGAALDRVDVLFLAGGEDVDPARYSAKPSPALGPLNKTRDDFEFRLIALARERRLPLFGVCRGLQAINVAFGGTLWQDIPTEHPSRSNHRKVEHKIAIEPGSRLAKALKRKTMTVNSTHHQSVKDPAPGFRIAARAPDGVVEAIESDDYPAVAVQFHPERMRKGNGKSVLARIFANADILFPCLAGKIRGDSAGNPRK